MINNILMKAHIRVKTALCNNRGAVGKEEIIGIAITMIVAAFIVIPQLRNFATSVMTSLTDWWGVTISPRIFNTN